MASPEPPTDTSDSAGTADCESSAGEPVFDCAITIPSDVSRGQEIQEQIMLAIESREFGPRSVFGMRLALEEAIINAIKHGNKRDPKKSVEIVWKVRPEHAFVSVEDEGPGFDPGDVPDPTDLENLDKPSGRGIMLMQQFLTRVEYCGRGNRVELELDEKVEREKAKAAEESDD